MRVEQTIFRLYPHLDLIGWEEAMDAADNMAAEGHQDVAIFWNPHANLGAKGHRPMFRLGYESGRPIGWKIVHVSPYLSKTSCIGPALVVLGIIVLTALLMVHAVCNIMN